MPRVWSQLVRATAAALLRRAELTPEARVGKVGEEAAYWYLRERSFVMVARNWRPEGLRGEIDLIGWDGDTIVFVEVKSRSGAELVTPEAAVDRGKQGHLKAAASVYRRKAHCETAPHRFDIVTVEFVPESGERQPRIQHFRDAFR